MSNHFYLILLYLVEWLLFLYVWKKFKKVFFSPSFYTVSVFIVATSLCLYCANFWDVIFYPISFVCISCGLLVMIFAESAAYVNSKKIVDFHCYLIKLPNVIKIGLAFYCIIATFLYWNEIRKIGLAHSMTPTEAIANVKADFESYEKNFNPIIRQGYKMVMAIAYIFTYAFINNYYICKKKIKECFWLIIPMLSCIVINLVSGSRGDMLRMFLLYLFAYYISKWQASSWRKQPTKKILKIAIPIFTILLSIFFMARLFVKVDTDSQKKIGGPVEYLAYYIGSPIQVFNLHAEEIQEKGQINENASFGYLTFSGLYSLLTKAEVLEAKDANAPKVGWGFVYVGGNSNAAGNVDTILAFPYADFGFFGMCIYIYIIYYLFSYFFYRKIIYKDMSVRYVKNVILFSFFFYEIEMAFYCDVTYQMLSQTGFLQLIVLLILTHCIIKPKYFVSIK